MEKLNEESIRKNKVILGAKLGEFIAPRIGNSIKTLCANVSEISDFLQMGDS